MTINDNFAKLSEALFIADRHARDEVKIRAEMQGKLATKEKKDKEEKLRSLAQMAREERSGITSAASLGANTSHNQQKPSSDEESSEEEMDEDEKRKLRERDQIRKDRQKQHERELRLNNMGAETKQKVLSKRYYKNCCEIFLNNIPVVIAIYLKKLLLGFHNLNYPKNRCLTKDCSIKRKELRLDFPVRILMGFMISHCLMDRQQMLFTDLRRPNPLMQFTAIQVLEVMRLIRY